MKGLLAALMLLILGVSPSLLWADDEALLDSVRQSWTGDFPGIKERGFIRVATAYNPIFFSFDGTRTRGMNVDVTRAFESHLAEHHPTKPRQLGVIMMPVPRDRILEAVLEGRADIAVANLTITKARAKRVAFSDPLFTDISEVLVTGPGAPGITSFDDLGEAAVHVRASSSYFEHLSAFNQARVDAGKAPIRIELVDERLEDRDILALVNAGTWPAMIIDSHKADLWVQAFRQLTLHPDLAVNTGGEIAWAVRPDNPELLAAVNRFVATIKAGTLLGNIMINRYLSDPEPLDNLGNEEAFDRLRPTLNLIRTFGEKYEFDWPLIAAQGYQESKFDQSKKSHAGAVGIMQVLPSTAADPNVGLPDISTPENNVHAGVKYLRFLRDHYFSDRDIEPMDRVLLSMAAYNAGPGNIARARKRAEKMGFDPDVWFGNVEIAAARAISQEPVTYVRNIYKYYVMMKHLLAIKAERRSIFESGDQ